MSVTSFAQNLLQQGDIRFLVVNYQYAGVEYVGWTDHAICPKLFGPSVWPF